MPASPHIVANRIQAPAAVRAGATLAVVAAPVRTHNAPTASAARAPNGTASTAEAAAFPGGEVAKADLARNTGRCARAQRATHETPGRTDATTPAGLCA